ncbi:pilus assembly protein PilP [Pseudomonas sp. BP8]|uniref:pilus assembly protein PilP n=1 Tax=Pseudomonas sp. BP8 TaxID=2817864 RepID=UPI001AE5F7D4|nr:pilus assembly protein PilP [Pseudomonas sp. BP8]MBP2259976.1 type IV pilus assembly protein PilP [Pseudomonas sp. BP8]HDS1734233.1 pilus assembly protein PilP [Pseudomonas putida]
MNGGWAPDLQALVTRSAAFRVILLIVLAVMVFTLGWVFRLHEAHQAYRLGAEALDALERAHASKSLSAQSRASAEDVLARSTAELQDARWRLAAGDGLSDLLDQLAGSGHAHGLLFERIEVLDELAVPGHRATPLQIEVVGSYWALRTWLDEWLGQVRLLRPSNLQLGLAPGRTGLLRMRLRVKAYDPGEQLQAPASLAHGAARPPLQATRADPFAPWSAQISTHGGLARVPLAQVEMVGSLARDGRYQALVRSAGRLYRLRPGDRLGRDEGVVVRVDEHQLEVLEQVFLGGDWQPRTTYLALRNRAGKEVKDEREAAIDVGTGSHPVDSGGLGDELRG